MNDVRLLNNQFVKSEQSMGYQYALYHKWYAEHLLHMNYSEKAKTKILWFKQFANDYALKNLKDKKIWNDVINDSYKGNFKFKDKLASINY